MLLNSNQYYKQHKNDYCPVMLTSIIMKCMEWLLMHHSDSAIPNSLHPLQSAYWRNTLVDDAVSLEPHTTLEYLDNRNTCARMLFIDFNSSFGCNTTVLNKLVMKLRGLGLHPRWWRWGTKLIHLWVHGYSPTVHYVAKFSNNLAINYVENSAVIGLRN